MNKIVSLYLYTYAHTDYNSKTKSFTFGKTKFTIYTKNLQTIRNKFKFMQLFAYHNTMVVKSQIKMLRTFFLKLL